MSSKTKEGIKFRKESEEGLVKRVGPVSFGKSYARKLAFCVKITILLHIESESKILLPVIHEENRASFKHQRHCRLFSDQI